MQRSPYRLFLIDGLGAILSAVSLGFILPYFNEYIGLPSTSLYLLAVLPVVFAAYSLACYYLRPVHFQPFLAGIAIANFAYCCLTTTVLLINRHSVTNLGAAYFTAEIIVISVLVYIEWRTAAIAKRHL
ncbi:hypothetical protein FUA23_08775 [Neolewinella aurantiaca]|uniref:Uncharacterized protein n=1 Tax=Neolewinella aurantiaca TaxID=2602767 RepID=A0A5C7FIT1_9BACT|nr:hypothetical protein [Neolewinella aurantiaca]TXF89771.1 hypothetical protein FUA23_08775 [Neolewinella aurantiaca]